MIKRTSPPLIAKDDVSELLLQQHLRTYKSNPKYIAENLYVFGWKSDMLIKTRSGYWYEMECKISFADFEKDFTSKWQKHELLRTGKWYNSTFLRRETDADALEKYEDYPGYHIEPTKGGWNVFIKAQSPTNSKARRPNYFSYCVPWYLSGKVLPHIPPYAGLIVLMEDGRLNEIKKPPMLHDNKYTDEELKLCDKFYYNWRNRVNIMERNAPDEQIKKLRQQVAFLKAEYKAVAGCDIKDAF